MARTPRTIEEAAQHLEASIPLIGPRYQAGVEVADWAGPASSDASESNFAAKMQQVISKKSRAAGVRKAGNESWRSGAITKGVQVIGEAVRRSIPKYQANFARPYAAAIQVVKTLPPRGLDAMANIDSRLKPVVRAFQANKTRGT